MSVRDADDADNNDPKWVYFIYMATLAPWGAMQVYDAIDAERRTFEATAFRLSIASALMFVATSSGLGYTIWVEGRSRAESATMLLGVVLNLWYWVRNIRGWYSMLVLRNQRGLVCDAAARIMQLRLQGRINYNYGEEKDGTGDAESGSSFHTKDRWIKIWDTVMTFNNTVIDNDKGRISLLDIWPRKRTMTSEVAGEVMWRMFWLQGTEGQMAQEMDASVGAELVNAYCYAPGAPPSQGQEELLKFEKLDELTRIHIQEQNEAGARHERHYSVPELDDYREHNLSQAIIDEMRAKADVQSEQAIKDFVADTPDERKRKLRDYDVGQQDIGKVVRLKDHESGVSQEGLQSALSWLTLRSPRPLENIWYESCILPDTLMREHHDSMTRSRQFPKVAVWYQIASDTARQRELPLQLSIHESSRYALRIASASALLVYHFDAYKDLCKDVYDVGVAARWTHGWSGRIACYTKYWTVGNVAISLLGGLPLLVITRNVEQKNEVKCLLVGLASENIMHTYLSDERRAARTNELVRRYKLNKGKTCRGSGVRCIRDALGALHLPRSASQLDGVVAFSAGWAFEACEGLPGNQGPRDGNDHGQIEDIYGSCHVYRYPDNMML